MKRFIYPNTSCGGQMATATKAKPGLKIHPLEDRVVIAPADETESMRGGLYIPIPPRKSPPRVRSLPWARAASRRVPACRST